MAEREDMANADETGNATDDMMGNTTEQEPDPPPEVPRLESSQEEEDECLQPPLKVRSPANILEEEDLDAGFEDDLLWEIFQDLEPATS